jgi:hypothetical protein
LEITNLIKIKNWNLHKTSFGAGFGSSYMLVQVLVFGWFLVLISILNLKKNLE